jgi:hypothetical protein
VGFLLMVSGDLDVWSPNVSSAYREANQEMSRIAGLSD